MEKTELIQLVRLAAVNKKIDPALVCAVVHQESSWNPWAIRYEPAFFDRYISHMSGLSITEKTARSTSWGLMQVMGQVAREYGFDGKYLAELCDPMLSVQYGIEKLSRSMKLARNDAHKALLKYNGGGNKDYPLKVLARLKQYQEE